MTTFANSSQTGRLNYLNSALKLTKIASIRAVTQGSLKFSPGSVVLGSSLGGITLSKCLSENSGLFNTMKTINQVVDDKCSQPVTKSTQTILDDALSASRSGTVNYGVDYATGELSELLPKQNSTFNKVIPFGKRPPALLSSSFTIGSSNEAYLFGGISGGILQNAFYSFNYIQMQWNLLSSGPSARSNHGAIFYNGLLYIFGGISGNSLTCDLWAYDTKAASWNTLSSTFCKSNFGYILVSDTIYIYGGYSSDTKISSDLVTIQLSTDPPNIQTIKASLVNPPPLIDCTMTTANDSIIMYGKQKLYYFNITSQSWSIKTPSGVSPGEISKGALFTLNNRLLFFGGSNSTASIRLTILYDSISNSWDYESAGSLSIPLESFSATLYTQNEGSCSFPFYPGLNYCKEETRPMILIYGGRTVSSSGVAESSDLLIYRFQDLHVVVDNTCGVGLFSTTDELLRHVCVECPVDTYNIDGKGTCTACPFGGVCPGTSNVLTSTGYWQDPIRLFNSTAPKFFKCDSNSKSCCQDSQCTVSAQCRGGSTGPLCSQCVIEHYAFIGDSCVFCPVNIPYILLLALGLLVVVLMMSFIPWLAHNNSWFLMNVSFCLQVLGLVSQEKSTSLLLNVLVAISKLDVASLGSIFSSGGSSNSVCLGNYDGVDRVYKI